MIPEAYRVRVGDYRILYEIDDAVQSVTVIAVRHRREAYRQRFVHLDDVLAQEAARLAADLRLRGADAVYVSVAALHGLPVFTWDMEMIRRAPLSVRVQTP